MFLGLLSTFGVLVYKYCMSTIVSKSEDEFLQLLLRSSEGGAGVSLEGRCGSEEDSQTGFSGGGSSQGGSSDWDSDSSGSSSDGSSSGGAFSDDMQSISSSRFKRSRMDRGKEDLCGGRHVVTVPIDTERVISKIGYFIDQLNSIIRVLKPVAVKAAVVSGV